VHRCSFVRKDIVGWACLQATCFLDKGDIPELGLKNLDFLKERSIEAGTAVNRHPNNSICLGQSSKFFKTVCKTSINKKRA
jgi:hypothetical protein